MLVFSESSEVCKNKSINQTALLLHVQDTITKTQKIPDMVLLCRYVYTQLISTYASITFQHITHLIMPISSSNTRIQISTKADHAR